MARSRNIKPGLYKNEDLAECSIWARYLFPGLWTLADREGRLEDRPKRIKAELLPFDTAEVDKLLQELHDAGFILRYQNEDGRFVQILKFKDHQSPHYSEKSSSIKPPILPESIGDISAKNSGSRGFIKRGSQPPDSLIPDSLSTDSPIPDSLIPDSPNPESRGKAEARASRLPRDWALPPGWGKWAEQEKGWSAAHVLQVADRFRDYWVAKAGKDGRKLDWQATWRNWVRNEKGGRGVRSTGNAAAAEEAYRRQFPEES